MLSFVNRAADKAVGLFLPKAEAKADTYWGDFCYCSWGWTYYHKLLYLGGGVNYVFDQTVLPDGPPSARQTYALLNATVGYSWEMGGHRLNLDLMGKNLADEVYLPSQSTRSRPREFLLTFTARF